MMKRKRNKKKFTWIYFLLTIFIIGVVTVSFVFSSNKEKAEGNKVDLTSSLHSGKKLAPKEKEPVASEEEEVAFSQQKDPQSNLDQKVEELMLSMTLEEKIGQLLVIGFPSNEVDKHAQKMIEEYHVGGIIYYDRNMVNPVQVTELSNNLQSLAMKKEKQIPLLISIDQEGGQIVRMRERVSPLPSQQELGKEGDSKAVYETARRNGKELKAMGIHVNFAPVLDLSTTDSRSFGNDPVKTGDLGEQVILGLADAGITGTLKHFPGNGRSNVDPHHETSSVQANQLDLENSDIFPFKKMIEEVNNDTFFTMVTHIKYPAYDKENPASISRVIIQELLRNKLGFNGIVVTDDIEMGAVSKYFTYKDLGYRAVEAGADLLLVCHTLEYQVEVFEGIKEAVLSKQLSEKRIDEAVKRILSYKLSTINTTQSDVNHAENIVGNQP